MALWICADCTAAYSVGAPNCPQCSSTEYVEEGAEEMAKITVHGGASNEAADEPEEGEDVSAGTSSSTSSEKEPNSAGQSETPDPSPARTTGSRSKRSRTETGGSAPSTATGGQKTAGSSDDK
jgi:hypothetical protein